MRTPRYTDGRYPNGYRKACDTDIRRTFERIRRERKLEKKAEQEHQIRRIFSVKAA